jgi:hypothetical protein
MHSADLYHQLKLENEQLHKELLDLNYLIELREEELLEIRKASQSIAELKSKLERNLYEFEQMQQQIETNQRKLTGAQRIAVSMEDEMMESIKIEKEYYQIKEEYNSNKIALESLNENLKELTDLYKEIASLKSKNSALESNLEIALMEINFLKEDSLK